jgi:type IX secretion system PorP/SprF family membrane protein
MLEGDDAGNGILKTTRFHGAYAYFLPINASTQIRLGVEGGLLQTYLNWDRLVFPDQLDLLNGPVQVSQERRPESTNHLRLDVGSGLLLLSKSYYFGLSAKHLTTPDLSFLQVNNNLLGGLPIRFTVQGGMQLNVKPGNKKHESSFIAPNALYTRQGTFQQLLLGMYAGLGSVYLGSWLRHTLVNADAVIVLVGFRQGLLRLGLSYDATISRLSGRSGGTFELTTGINFGNDSRRQKIKSRKNLNNCMGMFY